MPIEDFSVNVICATYVYRIGKGERKMLRKTVSETMLTVLMLAVLFVGMLVLVFDVQSRIEESGTARIDNLIITTFDLEAAASRLAQWKNSCGIPSKVLNLTWIYSHYSGVDEAEKIRNCIRDFHVNFQTKYVTIFGDTDKVPIRYAYVPDSHETLVPTDLYYADLDYSWDDNGDGLYADLGNDTVDGIPDVYVGRIPPSFNDTAEDVVTKIIEYQQDFDVSEDWVNRVVLAAGMDGNTTTALSEYISNIVSDKNVTKLYESAGNLTNDALDFQIDRGCLFLNFAGHSGETWLASLLSPDAWILRPHPWNPLDYEKYNWQDALDRTNGRKLPVIVTMSCVSAKVDWSSILGGECLGEYFVMNPHGGAIAYFGSTGIAYSAANESAPNWWMGEMDRRVFEAFYDGYTRLGDMWGVALTEFLQQSQPYHQLDYYFEEYGYLNEKTVMEFILLGDPTLTIYNGTKVHDVAVTNVAPYQTEVTQGYSVPINVTIANQGSYTETFNVTAYANETVIETREITLTSGNSTTITFTWNTTGYEEYKNHTISAYAHPVPGETSTDDNTFTDGIVFIVHVGDVNADGEVRIDDVLAVALAFGSKPGHPRWDANCDINCDGQVRVDDILATALEFGWTKPQKETANLMSFFYFSSVSNLPVRLVNLPARIM